MPFGCRELDQVPFFPKGGHAPGYLFPGFRNGAAYRLPDLLEIGLYPFLLKCDILIDIRRLGAIMLLILFPELSSALRTFPHHISLHSSEIQALFSFKMI